MESKHGEASSGKLTLFSLSGASKSSLTDWDGEKVIQGAAADLIEKLIAFKCDYP